MTIAEFKAWLEGYSANMGAAPTAEQWAAIKAKLDRLKVVSDPVWPLHRQIYNAPPMRGCPSYIDNKTVPLRAH